MMHVEKTLAATALPVNGQTTHTATCASVLAALSGKIVTSEDSPVMKVTFVVYFHLPIITVFPSQGEDSIYQLVKCQN